MIKVRDIKYVVFGVSNPHATRDFMQEFGLLPVDWPDSDQAVYLRGALSSPYIYVGELSDSPAMKAIGIEVESLEDLVQASRIDGASELGPLNRPGGGHCVEVMLPGGIRLELVHGMAPVAALPVRAPLTLNEGLRKSRYNQPQRPVRQSPQVLRLGHVALCVPDPVVAKDWAVKHLGMIVSDEMLVPGSQDQYIGFFMRWNHGAQPTDHHSLLIAVADQPLVHHISFELQDIDTVFMGHEWLKQQGHSPHWGVGRHVLGSQVFDYWWDPDGFRVEHYADGDLYDDTVPATTVEGTNEQLWTWGPHVPDTFFSQTRHG